jgi:hypothetical protein
MENAEGYGPHINMRISIKKISGTFNIFTKAGSPRKVHH